MARKLATIREIMEIRPIAGADLIEIAVVDGWQVIIAKKDGIKVRDKVCYFEIDSLLPQTQEFEFLATRGTKTSDDGTVGYRLKTIKLRGEISQGLILPITNFKQLNANKLKVGDDLTDKLGVSLYETPTKPVGAPPSRKRVLFDKAYKIVKSFSPTLARFIFPILAKFLFNRGKNYSFPSWIVKTEQERAQNLSGKWDQLSEFTYERSIKLDGSSMTVFHKDGKVGVCSRNMELDPKEVNKFNEIEQKYDIKNRLKKTGRNIALQGELIGENIQKNPEKIKGNDFYVFDVYDIDLKRYLTPKERHEFLTELNEEKTSAPDIKHVPVLDSNYSIAGLSVNDILLGAEGESLFSKNREGVVFKSNELKNGHVVHFKAISNKYLLKLDD